MRFAAITDTSGNLPTRMIKEAGLEIIAFPYFIDGREYTCLDTDSFHGDEFYARIKSGMKVWPIPTTLAMESNKITIRLSSGIVKQPSKDMY